jgi:type I restriction enzyme S subunit
LNQHIFKVVTPNVAQRRLVYYLLKYLRSDLIEIARNKQTTGLGHVTTADMKRLLVCDPPADVLAGFDSVVASIYDRSFSNELEVRILANLRDILLPKLLSGALTVPEHDTTPR